MSYRTALSNLLSVPERRVTVTASSASVRLTSMIVVPSVDQAHSLCELLASYDLVTLGRLLGVTLISDEPPTVSPVTAPSLVSDRLGTEDGGSEGLSPGVIVVIVLSACVALLIVVAVVRFRLPKDAYPNTVYAPGASSTTTTSDPFASRVVSPLQNVTELPDLTRQASGSTRNQAALDRARRVSGASASSAAPALPEDEYDITEKGSSAAENDYHIVKRSDGAIGDCSAAVAVAEPLISQPVIGVAVSGAGGAQPQAQTISYDVSKV